MGLKIKTTSLPHKEIHKGTWRSPDGRYINQIDHVLVNARFSNSILDVRTFRGAECGSDHFLVLGKLKVQLKKRKKRKEEQTELFDIQKLYDLKICEDFCKNISNEFNNEHIDNENDDIESLWSIIRNVIRKATKKTVGKRRFMRNPWFNQLCENALQRRKQAREVWLKDIQNEEKFPKYKTRLKEVTKIIRCEKRKFIKDIVRSADQDYTNHRTRDLYKKINSLSKDFKPKEMFLRNENDTLLTDRDDIVEEWAQYFDQLLNCREPSNPFLFEDKELNREDYPEPTIEEVAKQIKTLKNHKAPGEDGITGELLKTGDYQAGFRQNRSTIDQIFILRQVLQKTWEYDKSVHMVFIDYKKTYDSIHRASLIKILEEFGMPMTTGLRQGDAISPVLFNIVLEKVVREAALDKEGVKLGENNIGILAYADDIVLMADSKDKLKEQSKQLINAAKRVGLEINAEKLSIWLCKDMNK
ncbi:hypothetical protein QTP88_000729 [Uroleucon formosanum]